MWMTWIISHTLCFNHWHVVYLSAVVYLQYEPRSSAGNHATKSGFLLHRTLRGFPSAHCLEALSLSPRANGTSLHPHRRPMRTFAPLNCTPCYGCNLLAFAFDAVFMDLLLRRTAI